MLYFDTQQSESTPRIMKILSGNDSMKILSTTVPKETRGKAPRRGAGQ